MTQEPENILEDPSNNTTESTKTTVSGKSGVNKRFQKPLIIIAVIIAVVFAVLISFDVIASPYDKTDNTFSNVTIEEGDSLENVADKLEESGIVGDASSFVFVSKLTRTTNFKPGTYYLSPSMTSGEIGRTLSKGLTTSNGFTIPAGYTLEQIATALDRDGFVDKETFLEEAADPFFSDLDFIGSDISGSDQIEGFLLPDTYVINSNADESMIIFTMLDNFNNYFNDDYKARADELGLSVREVVIIASMIEQETTDSKERATISSVIHNRLNLELEEIPDVPLCSPSKDSIFAALYPDETDYSYYVLSDKLDGTHVFTSDETEYQTLLEAYNTAIEARENQRTTEDSSSEESSDSQNTEEEDNN